MWRGSAREEEDTACPTQDPDKKQVSQEGHTHWKAIEVRRDSRKGESMETESAAGEEGLSQEAAFELM